MSKRAWCSIVVAIMVEVAIVLLILRACGVMS